MPAGDQTAGASAQDAAQTNGRGILAMVLAMAGFAISDMLVKLAGGALPVGEIITLRGALAAVMVTLIATVTGDLFTGLDYLRSPKRWLIALRTVSEIGATICFLSGLVRLPFADASAIAQFVPLGVTAAAAIFLGEPVGWRRWLATFVGFIGVMIIIKPGTSAFDPAALWIVGSMVFVVTRDLVTRQIGAEVPSLFLISLSAVCVMLSGFGFLPFETWVMPSPGQVLLLMGSAVGVIAGYFFVIRAMQSGEVAIVAPFRYVVILYAILIGVVVFGERPPASTYLGIAIVIGAGLYTLHRERVRKRRLNLNA
jgi:drug/metabolite transporter (DMT)-like permease